jgi:hypothetical protein
MHLFLDAKVKDFKEVLTGIVADRGCTEVCQAAKTMVEVAIYMKTVSLATVLELPN